MRYDLHFELQTVSLSRNQKKTEITSMKTAKNLECCKNQIFFYPPLQILRSVRYIVSELFVEAFHATLYIEICMETLSGPSMRRPFINESSLCGESAYFSLMR